LLDQDAVRTIGERHNAAAAEVNRLRHKGSSTVSEAREALQRQIEVVGDFLALLTGLERILIRAIDRRRADKRSRTLRNSVGLLAAGSMNRPDGLDADGCVEVGCKEGIMSRRAEHWLAEQEVALLGAIYQLESPPESVDRRQPTRLDAQPIRVLKSRLPNDPQNRTATS
jgi:hypothetical protein